MLLHQSFVDENLNPVVSPSIKEKGEDHSLLRLNAANDGQLPVSMYIELDINFLGLKVPDDRFLIKKIKTTFWTKTIRPRCAE